MTRSQLDALIKAPTHQGHRVLPERTVKIKQRQDNVEFAAMVESVDESLGRILRALAANGGADDTIIVFYSDNGGMSAGNWGNPARVVADEDLNSAYATSNLPLRGAKGWLYEGGIRVPLIVSWPNEGASGYVSDSPVTSADLFPTLLEMAGLPALPDQHVDGVSFADAVKGKALEPRSLFWHFPHYSNHGMQSPVGAIRSGSYKLLEYFENGTTQLFNLADDPGEQFDLVGSEPETTKALLAELRAWRERVDAAMPTSR
jgi:arylsulfatase A-like enzyme